MQISKEHPRYKSLVTREMMAQKVKEGIVAPAGLIAHGRGEAFDYLLGERTTENARKAEAAAAALMLEARKPVISVNGNAAALCADGIVNLAQAVRARVEVNLFHRTPERVEKVISVLEAAGAREVLGRTPDAALPGIASERALCCRDGIYSADAVLVPLEDGDRAEALVRAGKKVIAIDLNPLSRTARAAHITIVDELTRAIPSINSLVPEMKRNSEKRMALLNSFDNAKNLEEAMAIMCANLRAAGGGKE
ncbi:MAG: 4-phosphopantoate--beta-alanine ligase [Methanomassiliicoccales archaeon]